MQIRCSEIPLNTHARITLIRTAYTVLDSSSEQAASSRLCVWFGGAARRGVTPTGGNGWHGAGTHRGPCRPREQALRCVRHATQRAPPLSQLGLHIKHSKVRKLCVYSVLFSASYDMQFLINPRFICRMPRPAPLCVPMLYTPNK